MSWLMLLSQMPEIVFVAVKKLLQLALIIIPLMVVVEALRFCKLIDWLEPKMAPLTRWLKLPSKAAIPLLAGFCFGILYGASILLEESQRTGFSHRDCFLIGFFLILCHSLEDMVVLVAAGVNFFFVLIARILLAVILTGLLARIWKEQELLSD